MYCMKWLTVLAVIVLVCGVECRGRPKSRSRRNQVSCRPKSLVRYKLTMRTLWSKKVFPKMYPMVRPPAQWSSIVGRTHSSGYTMWREGENVTYGVQKMAEAGDPRLLQKEVAQGHAHILDAFTAPPITRGSGSTSAIVTLDGTHSQISFLMKLIPSPDWFIGLSMVSLCSRGRWRKNVHINLRPYDAGSDRGLTFTAPKWSSDPQGPVTRVTSQLPNHPASSFYYPDLKILPRIAYVDLDLVAEYRLRKTFLDVKDLSTKPTARTTSPPTSAMRTTHVSSQKGLSNGQNDMNTTTTTLTREKQESFSMDSPYAAIRSSDNQPKINVDITTESPIDSKSSYSLNTVPQKKKTEIRRQDSHEMIASKDKLTRKLSDSLKLNKTKMPSDSDKVVTKKHKVKFSEPSRNTSRKEVINEPIPTANEPAEKLSHTANEPAEKLSPQAINAIQFTEVAKDIFGENEPSGDCLVSEWSEWSPCSRTCGFGKKFRTREILAFPQGAGAPCPQARYDALCGSMRDCKWDHFKFLAGPSKRRSRGRRPNRRKPANRRNSTLMN